MRVLLVVAYDGTNYHGWQRQENAVSVESVLTDELTRVLKENIELIGASRTDAGVHALGNVAVFDTNTTIPADKICFAVNQSLPADIRVVKSYEVAEDFHPRYTECTKTYEYVIANEKIYNPLNRLYSYGVYYPLDVDKMQEAAKYLEGEHDFAGFCSAGSQVKTTVRTIYHAEVVKQGSLISLRVTGNGFLYNMVRIIAGTLVEVGKGYIVPKDMPAIIASKDRRQAGPTAPAQGLKLIEIIYDKNHQKVPKTLDM